MYNLKLKLGSWNSANHSGTPELCVIDFGNFDSFAKCQKFYKKFVESSCITFPDGSSALRSCIITPIEDNVSTAQSADNLIPF